MCVLDWIGERNRRGRDNRQGVDFFDFFLFVLGKVTNMIPTRELYKIMRKNNIFTNKNHPVG